MNVAAIGVAIPWHKADRSRLEQLLGREIRSRARPGSTLGHCPGWQDSDRRWAAVGGLRSADHLRPLRARARDEGALCLTRHAGGCGDHVRRFLDAVGGHNGKATTEVIRPAGISDGWPVPDQDLVALQRMEALGRGGFTVSVCCGPSGPAPFRWTVQVLSRDGQEFERPFAADSFAHAIEIAEMEIAKRGWADA